MSGREYPLPGDDRGRGCRRQGPPRGAPASGLYFFHALFLAGAYGAAHVPGYGDRLHDPAPAGVQEEMVAKLMFWSHY